MSLVETFQVGQLRCHALDAGGQRLDGGAMFGVVPKPLWERKIPADDRNRIPLLMRCLLIEHDEGPILIDTGAGNKENEKFVDIYGLDNSGKHGRTRLEDALGELDVQPGDVRWVINTHLHFDHAGGNTYVEGPDAPPRVAFPNATYVVQRKELEFGAQRNERIAASYLPKNYQPVIDAGLWQFMDGPGQILPGIAAIHTPGHTPHHQSILIADSGEKACFLGDVVPTAAHLPLPWIMGYDVEPLVTLESKRSLLATACEEKWLLIFEHDVECGVGKIVADGRKYRLTTD